MAVLTVVDRGQIERLVREYNAGEVIDFTGIDDGIENTNYFVDTVRGRFVLTVIEQLSAVEMPFFNELTACLARHGIPCPSALPREDGAACGQIQGKPAILVNRLPGASVMHPGVDGCRAVGALLARMHAATRTLSTIRDDVFGLPWMTQLSADLLPHLPLPQARLLADELDFQMRVRNNYEKGIIHGDLFRDNVLFDDGKISGVIDFYFASRDALSLDLAITVNDWCTAGQAIDMPRARALISAYTGGGGHIDADSWPAMTRRAALRFWLSRLKDRHFPRAGLVQTKDPDEYQALLVWHRDNSVPVG